MKHLIYLVLFILTLFPIHALAQVAAEECADATLIDVLNNAYTGNTSLYSGADAGWIQGSNQFCGGINNSTIENNGYFKFVALNNTVSFDICALAGCSGSGSFFGVSGIQAPIFHFTSGSCGSGNIVKDYCLKQLSGPDCGSCGNPKGCLSETVSVVPGRTYYFMIDGYEGDDCPFSISFSGGILPIEIANFEVACRNNNVEISWNTLTETNNDFFTLERAGENGEFKEIKKIQGQGNSSTFQNYSVTDMEANGLAYYRLKQTDYNGNFKYFPIKTIECGSSEGFEIYPNPAYDKIQILGEKSTDPFSLVIYNSAGKVIHSEHVDPTGEIYTLNLNNKFSKGIYLINLTSKNSTYTKRISVLK